MGLAARAVAVGGPGERSCVGGEAAGLRSGCEPGELVSRLCSVLRPDVERQESVCRDCSAGGAEAGIDEEALGVRVEQQDRARVRGGSVAARSVEGYVQSI